MVAHDAAGLGSGFAGHSGRVGMARRMAAAGAPTHGIMVQGRWKTARMVEVYTRAEEARRGEVVGVTSGPVPYNTVCVPSEVRDPLDC